MQDRWTGQTLAGRYQIDDLIGRGGMSSVYRATDSNLKRMVAVKFIHQHLTGEPEFLRRFQTEAEAVAQLRHPNIIQVFDFSDAEGQYYMVMEMVAGESLQQRLRRLNEANRKFSTEEAIKIIAAVCDGVDYAHKRGMIHRDIKPANIMLSVQGDAILADFGIAKIAGATTHTAAGAVIGTAMYMSPEQIRGEQIDGRTDIYALGITLFEMVCGRPPFKADSAMTVLMMHLDDPLPDVRELNPDVPPGLAAVLEKALAKKPEDRYATAGEMAAALRALADGTIPAAAPPTDAETVIAKDPAADATLIAGGGAGSPPPPPSTTAKYPSEPEPAAAAPGGGSSAPPPPPPSAAEGAGGRSGGGIPPWVLQAFAGGAVVAAIIIVLVATGVIGGSGGDDDGGEIVQGTATESPTPTPTDGVTEAPTSSPAPTDPPSPYARINDITLDGSTYVVDYETFGYTETLPGQHVHFFFDTVPPEEAGVPGSGPWELYGGPRPFTVYTTADRPEGAQEMCALVANEDHSVIQGTGNCVPLP
jgi:tRNA A-37 threonylcarbamoyl transferase component Bud32